MSLPRAVPAPVAAEARRLTGPNLFSDAPGAALDVVWRAAPGGRTPDARTGAPNGTGREPEPPNATVSSAGSPGDGWPDAAALDDLAARWCEAVAGLAAALAWPAPTFAERRSGDAGAHTLALYASAPVDQLDAAVDVAERAWAAALAGAPVSDAASHAYRTPVAATLRPALPALIAAADAHGLTVTWDDEAVSVGVGAGSRTWTLDALPAADAVDWDTLRDAPVALVTGSNGKTTTTRLVAAMLRAAGHTVGVTSTDGVRVEGPTGAADVLEAGDWAGPGGARLALRDPRVTAAVLETARGGILRRGLAVRRAAAAAVTNIAADHYGDYGIYTLEALADAKLVVARALVPTGGPLVLSADDATLRARGASHAGAPFPRCWVASDSADAEARAVIAAHTAGGGRACLVTDGVLRWYDGAAWHNVVPVSDIAVAAGGAARHNVANAATATALAVLLGAPLDAVRTALRSFGGAPADNPGRLQVLRVGDVTTLVDYAHNPAGLTVLLDAARHLGGGRRLLVLGQAGDRDDAALGELARTAWAHGTVDRVQLKELEPLLRGRTVGEVSAVLRGALAAAGAPATAVAPDVAPDEAEAVRRALAWARPGDLLILPLHVARDAVVAWLRALDAAGWRAGMTLPDLPHA